MGVMEYGWVKNEKCKMKKWKTLSIITLAMILILIQIINADNPDLPKCKESLAPGDSCVYMTVPIRCSTYSLYNYSSGKRITTDTPMTLINDSMYYIVFNETNKGNYIVKLCDNSTVADIIVEADDWMELSIILVLTGFGIMFLIFGVILLLRPKQPQ